MELDKNILEHIIAETKRISHGRVIIELNETSKKIDVVAESRSRFKDSIKK